MRRVHASSGRQVAGVAGVDVTAVADTAAGVTVAKEEAAAATSQPDRCCGVRYLSRFAAAADLIPRAKDSTGYGPIGKIWAGLDSNQRRRKASRFTVCPVWPLRYLPV